MDEEEKTAALEESEPLASLDASRSGRPEKSGREEQPSFARGFGRAKKEIDRKLDETGVDPNDSILDDDTKEELAELL